MNNLPKLLGVFADIYGSNDKMTFSKAVLTAVVGFCTVLIILAVIALFIKFIAFLFSLAGKKAKPDTDNIINNATAPIIASAQRSQVELINVDEETAAVIMALVSHNSGIDLDRLDFKSIKLLEEK